jgi:TRAP-type mannitol/chloroaromatic compound transport system permease small subunit
MVGLDWILMAVALVTGVIGLSLDGLVSGGLPVAMRAPLRSIGIFPLQLALVAVALALGFILFRRRSALDISRGIDTLNTNVGKVVAWAIFVAVVVSAVNAIVRKAFNMSSNSWLELQWVLFGLCFLMCASWTMLSNEHIRIDVVSSLLSKTVRNWIDIVGHTLFLIPICLVMIYYSWPFAMRSLMQNEQSTNAGGLPVYPAKFLVPLGFTLLFLQAISELIKRWAIMQGRLADVSGGGHHEAAEAEAARLRESLAAEAAERERAAGRAT